MEVPESSARPAPRPVHPLPAWCWMWPLGGAFLTGLGAIILWVWSTPPAEVLEKYPRDHPRWMELLLIGIAGLVTGAVCWWHWYRFAIRQQLNRATWHTGTGILLTGAGFLFITGWILSCFVFLLCLAVWTQGLTRRHFDLK